jgi:hypothetical protein
MRGRDIALGGFSVPGFQRDKGQAARALRLAAGYAEQVTGREAYAAIPCAEDRYIAWAEASGLRWSTRELS